MGIKLRESEDKVSRERWDDSMRGVAGIGDACHEGVDGLLAGVSIEGGSQAEMAYLFLRIDRYGRHD